MPVTGSSRLPTGTVTFLFTDIEGSTQLVSRLGDRYPALLERHAEILRSAIVASGGTVVSTERDAFFAVFPSSANAVAAAVGAQRSLSRVSWPDGVELRVRMGLHSGEGRPGADNYVGIDVHRAARIAAVGHGGQVLASDATRVLTAHALPEGVALADLGEHQLKDIPAPERIWQLEVDGLPHEFPALRSLGARPDNLPRAATPLIGRERELAEVGELLGERRLLTLSGPGGRMGFFKLLADLDLQLGRPERAVVLAGSAERHRDEVGGELPDALTRVGKPGEEARPLLSEERYAQALAEGRAMNADEAVAYALADETGALSGSR